MNLTKFATQCLIIVSTCGQGMLSLELELGDNIYTLLELASEILNFTMYLPKTYMHMTWFGHFLEALHTSLTIMECKLEEKRKKKNGITIKIQPFKFFLTKFWVSRSVMFPLPVVFSMNISSVYGKCHNIKCNYMQVLSIFSQNRKKLKQFISPYVVRVRPLWFRVLQLVCMCNYMSMWNPSIPNTLGTV